MKQEKLAEGRNYYDLNGTDARIRIIRAAQRKIFDNFGLHLYIGQMCEILRGGGLEFPNDVRKYVREHIRSSNHYSPHVCLD